MISFLKGKLCDKKPTHIVIEVNGIGYEVLVSMMTFFHLPAEGELLHLYTHLNVREDGHFLYGFDSEIERTLFRELIKISGVGPKLALTILSGMEPSALLAVLGQGDVGRLKSLPGVGPKLAERLVIEMRDKIKKLTDNAALATPVPLQTQTHIFDEALEALLSLGYKAAQARKMLESCQVEDTSVENLIRMALQVRVA